MTRRIVRQPIKVVVGFELFEQLGPNAFHQDVIGKVEDHQTAIREERTIEV